MKWNYKEIKEWLEKVKKKKEWINKDSKVRRKRERNGKEV